MARARLSAEELLQKMDSHGFSSIRLEGRRIVWGLPNHWECSECESFKRAASKRFDELAKLLRARKKAALKTAEPTRSKTSVESLLARMNAHGYHGISLRDGALDWTTPPCGGSERCGECILILREVRARTSEIEVFLSRLDGKQFGSATALADSTGDRRVGLAEIRDTLRVSEEDLVLSLRITVGDLAGRESGAVKLSRPQLKEHLAALLMVSARTRGGEA